MLLAHSNLMASASHAPFRRSYTAKSLGFEIPLLLARADEVIE